MTRAPLTLEQAQSRLLELVRPLPGESLAVNAAFGRTLASPLVAQRTQPCAPLSAMDGYAVRSDDLAGPWHVIGESAAGHPFTRVAQHGEAVRISTGALLPDGTQAVIVQEDVALEGRTLTLTGSGPDHPERHVRALGMDFRQGTVLLDAGTRLEAPQLALATAAGHAQVNVHVAPSLAVIDTGDELSGDPTCVERHRIPASNGPMLAALAAPLCRSVARLGPVPDSLDAIVAALDRASDVDVIVTSGGASVGDHDLLAPALERWGANIDFWRVAIKPGKPLMIATRESAGRRTIIVGLPGNPVSAFVTGYLFLVPLLRHLSGSLSPLPMAINSVLASGLPAGGKRREFIRARWNGENVQAMTKQDSGALTSLAMANALIDRAAGAAHASAGDPCRIYFIRNGGIA